MDERMLGLYFLGALILYIAGVLVILAAQGR